MSRGPYVGVDIWSGALVDDQIQAMACRQFGVSLAVGLALLIAAAAIGGRGVQVTPPEVGSQHRVIHPEAPRLEIGQSVLGAKARG